MFTYTWYQWLCFFYLYCFIGWIFESSYVSAKEGHFVNRGFLRLPLLPLYGTGAVLILWVSLPFRGSPLLVGLAGAAAATVLEYVTGWVMERLFKVKYWDYSYKKFQLDGYICLSSTIAWGALSVLLTEVVHRAAAELVFSLPRSLITGGDVLISALFIRDTVQSVQDALGLKQTLETMTRLKAELEEIQIQLALMKMNAMERLSEYRDGTAERMDVLRGETAGRMERWKSDGARLLERWMADATSTLAEMKNDRLSRISGFRPESLTPLLERGRELLEKRRAFTEHLNRNRRDLLLRNPHAVSRRFDSALKELYSIAERQRKQSGKH